MSIRQVKLAINEVEALPLTSVVITDSIPIHRVVETWSILFSFNSPDADPIITIQGSNDNTNWTSAYGVTTTLTAAVNNTINGFDSVDAVRFPFNYMRVKIDNNSGTTGTMTGTLSLGYDEQ